MSAFVRALDYQRRGFALLPLRARSKHPHHEITRRLRATSSTRSYWSRRAEPDEIAAWSEIDPEANLGICCGEASGLVVVDQDVAELPAGVTIPATPFTRTSRGFQFFLADGNSPSRTFDWGELRGEGAYVVAPPSVHPSGLRYRWELTLDELPLAPLDQCELPSALLVEVVDQSELLVFRSELLVTGGYPEADEAVAQRLCEALGISKPLGRAFRCLLHADRSPSASVWRAQDGFPFSYHDWHRGEWRSLSSVRAELAGAGRVSGVELGVWRRRLLAEAGVLTPVDLSVAFDSEELEDDERIVFEGFLFLLGLRWLSHPGTAAPYAARFVPSWTGLPFGRAYAAFRGLRRRGLIVPAGSYGRLPLWLPKAVVPLGE